MRLFLSALLLAALPAAFAQNPSPSPDQKPAERAQGPGHFVDDLWAYKVEPQRSCPVFLTAASVDAPAHYLPTSPQGWPGKHMLDLHLQYQSRLPVESVRMTAHVRIKTDKYALDATDLEVPITIHGTADFNRAGEHDLQFPLPPHIYPFGVAQVSIDSITFTSGRVWRPQGSENCSVTGQGTERIAK